MGLFTRRRSGRPSSGHAGDDQVLGQLEAMGADLSRSRLWEHFVYCDDEEGAAQLEAAAVDAGWDVQRVAPGDHGIVASRRAVSPWGPWSAQGASGSALR